MTSLEVLCYNAFFKIMIYCCFKINFLLKRKNTHVLFPSFYFCFLKGHPFNPVFLFLFFFFRDTRPIFSISHHTSLLLAVCIPCRLYRSFGFHLICPFLTRGLSVPVLDRRLYVPVLILTSRIGAWW